MKKYKYFDWLKRIIVVLFFVILFSPVRSVKAMTQEDAGATLAEFASNFARDHELETVYSSSDYDREQAYIGKKVNGYYGMDCVGWVSFAIHNALDLGDKNNFKVFVQPEYTAYGQSFGTFNGFEQVADISDLQPGDIIAFPHHVGVYVGNDEVVHCDGWGQTISALGKGAGVHKETISSYRNRKGEGIQYLARISEQTAAGLNESACTTIFGSYTGASVADDYGKYWGTTTGRYTGSYSLGDWLFSLLAGLLDYLIGILTMIIRIPLIGWTNVVEVMVCNFFEDLEGVETEAGVAGATQVTSGETMYEPKATDDGWNRINIEDVIFNRVPMLDVNVFSFDYAGGKELQEGSVIHTLRSNVAIWYNVIRRISIGLELLILLYLGLQLAISTGAGKRANYKSMLVAWVTSFIVIFTLHYYMLAVVYSNQFFVDLFYKANQNAVKLYGFDEDGAVSIYDTIRTRAYSFKMSEGVPATIMYMVLVYYLIKYLYIYFKRYLTVNILVILGPIVAIKYAFDRIKKGKASSLTNWMFDFFINVFLQTIHAMLYTVFMTMAFRLSTESVAGFIFALVILHFIPKTEQMFLDIFKFESRGNTLRDTRENKNYLREAVQTGVAVGLFAKSTAGVYVGAGKFFGGLAYGVAQDSINVARFAASPIANGIREKHGKERVPYHGIDIADEVGKKVKKVGYGIGDKINDKLFNGRNLRLNLHNLKQSDPKLYEAAKKALDSNKKRIKKNRKRTIKLGTNAVSGLGKVFVGIPMSIVDTEGGVVVLASGIKQLQGLSRSKRRYGYKPGGNKEKKLRKIAGVATGTGAFVAGGMIGGIPGAVVAGKLANDAVRGKEYRENKRKEKEINARRGRRIDRFGNVMTMGVAGGIAEEIKNVSNDAIENRKAMEKLDRINDIIDYKASIGVLEEEIGLEIDKMIEEDEIARRKEKENKTAEEQKKIDEKHDKELKAEIKHAEKTVIAASVINKVVKEYMFKNNITELKEQDVYNVLKELETQASDGTIKIEFAGEVKKNVQNALKKEINRNSKRTKKTPKLDDKKVTEIIQEGILEEDSVKLEREVKPKKKGEEPKQIEPKNKELTQKIRELKTLADKAKMQTGENITDVNRYINNRIETAKEKAKTKFKE